MQSIIKHKKTDAITLQKGRSSAEISLTNGGSLTKLVLNNKLIIKDFSDKLSYEDSYASAILFPFSNRIDKGEYYFSNKKYQLDANSIYNNAIHGLVYNKPFILVKEEIELNHIAATIAYREVKKNNGFPFLYSIYITYTLSETTLSLDITVKNEDATAFPFTIGWHPYFYTSDLHKSILEFSADKEIIHDEKMIPIKISDGKIPNTLTIGNQKFDNCYTLKNNFLNFTTPEYSIQLNSSFDKNYVQLYTPDLEHHIAIEPITGPSDSFNNQLGLQILEADTTFSIQWTIQLQHEKL